MLVSVQWLKDYLAKADIKIDAHELAQKMTMRGISVASIRRPAASLENIIIGRIEKIEKHPNADRLQITHVLVSLEAGASTKQIVCGAKNIAEGDLVPVALPGATLPGDLNIKVSSIRGVESNGMICSGKELGISDDSEGILKLPKHSVVGHLLSELLGGSDDSIIEFEITPNRPDCLGMIGLAREAAPLLNTKVREPKITKFTNSAHRTSAIVKVEVENPEICPRYVARIIDGLKVADSPDWLKTRLQTVNIKPINNIVDITNFVMLEYGQPLHAFDLRKIESGGVRVAPCRQTMDFMLLNGEMARLEPGDILIMDGERPIALAGIMGGANTQVEDDTTSILLESASFCPDQIRRTARRLGIQTDSSKRFEKGRDLVAVATAGERASSLLRDLAHGNVYHPPIDTREEGIKEDRIALDMRDVRRVIGIESLTAEAIVEHLEAIAIVGQKKSWNILSITLPHFRPDLKESIDIIEEVARLVGYENIPQKITTTNASLERIDDAELDFEWRAKKMMIGLGFRETIHYSFTSEAWLHRCGIDTTGHISLKNPISEEMKLMRQTLLPSLLQTYQYNLNRKTKNQRIFEVARVYERDTSEETGIKETPWVAALLSGNVFPAGWRSENVAGDFFHMKGIVESLIRNLTTVYLAYEPNPKNRLFHPQRCATLKLGLKEVGTIGEIHPFTKKHLLETDEPVVLFELNLAAIKKYEKTITKYVIPSKFPPIELDVALVVDKNLPSASLMETIRNSGGGLLSQLTLFDVYEGANIPEDKKSVAFRLQFVAQDRTLKDSEITDLKERMLQTLKDKHDAQIRS